MEKGLKGYRPLLLLLLCGGMTLKAAAQAAITDPLNTAQSTLTAGNTAATVKQVTESVNRLQTALDYVQKVSATVRRARMFTDLIDRQNRLNSNCLRTLEEAEKMDMKGLPGITSAVQDVVANNAAIISLTGDILSSDLKMNDSERMEQLDGCLQEVRRQEASLGRSEERRVGKECRSRWSPYH